MLLTPLVTLFLAGLPRAASPQETPAPGTAEPPARALSRRLTAEPRLAGTAGGARAADLVAGVLADAGFGVALDRRVVLLSYPRRIELRGSGEDGVLFEAVETFDPRAEHPDDVPPYNAYGKSGTIDAPVVDVGHGARVDYERLAAEGVEVAGRIALARYGGSYRGVKAALAEEHGCVGCLLFSEPADDGAEQGATWPDGPWKPGWAAQRGSIAPLAVAPGDPTTPGWPSPAPGAAARRLDAADLEASLPGIPCVPIGADQALALLVAQNPRVFLSLDAPRELATIVNVIAWLDGEEPVELDGDATGGDFVVAGNHRDAWVRGAQDAGSGTVSLLRAAQILGARVRAGWKPANGIVLGFWDAEEFGLIGSTEWGEAHAKRLERNAIAYVNADAVVSGLRFHASGTPGLLPALRSALERVPAPMEPDARADTRAPAGTGDEDGSEGAGGGPRTGSSADGSSRGPRSLWQAWSADGEPELGLPGSGSDYTVFLHRLGIPILDIGFGGNPGGQYHTVFDDFAMMDRWLDPTWEGHETAGRTLAEILAVLADGGRHVFDDAAAARAMARMVRETGAEDWLGKERAERLGGAFDELAAAVRESEGEDGGSPGERQGDPAEPRGEIYRRLRRPGGLVDRPWYKNRLWAPGLDTGYAAETLPSLRVAAAQGDEALDGELAGLVQAVERLAADWSRERDHPAKAGQ